MVKVKPKRHLNNLKTVSFDEEIISKESANKLLSSEEQRNKIKKENIQIVENENGENTFQSSINVNDINNIRRKKSKKKKTDNGSLNFIDENNDRDFQVDIEAKRRKIKEVNEKQNGNAEVEYVNKKSKKDKVKHKNKNNVSEEEILNEANRENIDKTVEFLKTVKHKKNKIKNEEKPEQSELFDQVNVEKKEESNEKKIKRKKKNKVNGETLEQPETTDEVTIENPKVKTEESIRAKKRQKHAKLLEEKRLVSEQSNQQNVLNYLSKWKHCRSEWKFEKLKQIWLQQNMFSVNKIPDEFWETVVAYFSESKGFIRNVILRDALKIIEKEEQATEENTDENYLLILQRARDIVQNLQE